MGCIDPNTLASVDCSTLAPDYGPTSIDSGVDPTGCNWDPVCISYVSAGVTDPTSAGSVTNAGVGLCYDELGNPQPASYCTGNPSVSVTSGCFDEFGQPQPASYCLSGVAVPGGASSGSPCPSLEQLMGITDNNDPCQNGTAAAGRSPGGPASTTGNVNSLGSSVAAILTGLVRGFAGSPPSGYYYGANGKLYPIGQGPASTQTAGLNLQSLFSNPLILLVVIGVIIVVAMRFKEGH